MQPLSSPKFITKRLASDWKLLLSIFSGILIASTLVAGAPVYLNSLERLALDTAIDRASPVFLDILAYVPNIPLDGENLERTDQEVETAIERNIPEFYVTRERYLKGPTLLVGTPRQPLSNASDRVSRGYFQYMSNVEKHVVFNEGRMATDEVLPGEGGPSVEIVIGSAAVTIFGLELGDKVIVTPSLGDPARITATIVGIMDPADPTEEFWQHSANIFVEPAPLEEVPDVGVEIDPEEPPLAMFVTRRALIDSMGKAYPGTLVSSSWFIFVAKEPLKKIRPDDLRARIASLETRIASTMQGAAVFTGIKSMLSRIERRGFFSSVPLLLLLTIMVITVMYYLAMMVSYLVQSREADVALLRSRGVSTLQLVRLYALEGLVITLLAVIIAPFLAMGAIKLAGTLPYFDGITSGRMLPVELRWTPFLVSALVGLVSMAVFVVPGVIGARTGLIIHKLRSSRPPSVPFFQRYYLDILLLIIGGLVFWELNARGRLISGGLFRDVEVNEALLLAPVLVLTLVALIFMRFFPVFVRFISGESPALIHLLVGASTAAFAAALLTIGVRAGEPLAQLLPIALALAVALTYWATDRAQRSGNLVESRSRARIYGLAAQAALVAIVMFLRPPELGTLSFLPSIGLILIVPAQLLYFGFQGVSRVAPVWLSMGLWHMARNPLQYSWLVLLLVMVTGLAVLATTVGGTLSRSYEERILYDVGADMRVTGIPGHIARGTSALKERYMEVPGITDVSLALRSSGTIGSNLVGNRFEVLAVESKDFLYMAADAYRPDFSERPLPAIMRALQPLSVAEPLMIPDDTVGLGVWAKPEDRYPNMFLWLVIQDARGVVDTVTLGPVGEPEWHLMTTRVASHLARPLQLVSIQIFEPVFGPAGTPGSIRLDDIHAIRANGSQVILDDFEEARTTWLPLATSILSSDAIMPVANDVHNGDRSGVFRFGKDTDRGIRGVYLSPSGGPLPVVASSTFMRATGRGLGEPFIVDLMGRLIPITIQDSVDYFPTLHPGGAGFVVADLDNLLRHLNILSPTSIAVPNELFISQAPGAGESVREVMTRLVGEDLVRDRETQIEEIRLDPLITAGWQATMLVALAIIIFSAGLGYVTYLLAFANRSRSEMGFLQSLGLSSRQLLGLLSLEHLVIVLVGLVLGTVTGLVMSDLMVTSVAVTEEGAQVVPPFILQTDLRFLAPVYAVLIAIFVFSIFRLGRSMLHVDLQTLSRLEGT
jgi:hypothetical protein